MKSESATLEVCVCVKREKREGKKRLGLKIKKESDGKQTTGAKKKNRSNSLLLSLFVLSVLSVIPHMNPLCGRSTVCTNAASKEKPASGAWATSAASASEGEIIEGNFLSLAIPAKLAMTMDCKKKRARYREGLERSQRACSLGERVKRSQSAPRRGRGTTMWRAWPLGAAKRRGTRSRRG